MTSNQLKDQWLASLSPEQSALYGRMLAPNTRRQLVHRFCSSISDEQWRLYSAWMSARIRGDA
jgi:hypothetical protein